MPAEWEPQSAVLLTWPHEQTDWHDQLELAHATFLQIALAVCRHQALIINCQSFEIIERIADELGAAGVDPRQVKLVHAPSNDTWVRDHGPITVYERLPGEQEPEAVLIDFQFNAWGGKFAAEKDNQLTTILHELDTFGMTQLHHVDYILEGGAIESNGAGTILTTTRCVTSATRNPEQTKTSVNKVFAKHFGCDTVHWLDHGYLAGDDTDGHIDTLARFYGERHICYVQCQDPEDEHKTALDAMEAQLQALRTIDHKPYELTPLPMVSPQFDDEGNRLPATYANFLIINDAVLLPTYNAPEDEEAIRIVGQCFPDREVIPIDCSVLITQGGSLHCVTMQLPEGVD
ncbi:agmatine deiminase family protein [Allohahella marinimesophila]|uniref:Agmatine deiminase family protein n=1 Tax=Allohahella marinimesophila TaxID=1054972 RepID=A0ABP7NNS9_9GAMM